MQRITVKIDRAGKVTIHVQGVQGAACTAITAGLLAKLGPGAAEEFQPTDEMYQTNAENEADQDTDRALF